MQRSSIIGTIVVDKIADIVDVDDVITTTT
jgi:hypothetical protein